MTFVGVSADVGRARLELVGDQVAPRLISVDANGAKVALVATTALLLGGDSVEVELHVGPGAWLEIVETAGTVAYDADGAPSRWKVRAVVEAGGLLLWHGEPFVVSDGANTVRCSTFDLGDGAISCIRETVVLGRSGERGGAVRLQNRVNLGGKALLVEDLDLMVTAIRELPGVLGIASVIDTVTLIGAVRPELPELPAGTLFRLGAIAGTIAGTDAGTIGRVLRTDLAGTPGPTWWSSWSAAATNTYAALGPQAPAVPADRRRVE